MDPILTTVAGSFDFRNFSEVDIKLFDITNSLARISRFNGHYDDYNIYSVADHTLDGLHYLNSIGASDEFCAAWVVHDGHEAYTGDLSKPFKVYLELHTDIISKISYDIDLKIWAKFTDSNVDVWDYLVAERPDEATGYTIKYMDYVAARNEALHLRNREDEVEGDIRYPIYCRGPQAGAYELEEALHLYDSLMSDLSSKNSLDEYLAIGWSTYGIV